MWYSWVSVDLFDMWHENAKVVLGIPHPNRNQATGEIDEDAQWTIAYTEPVIVAEDDVRAIVKDDVAALVPDGLGVPSDPPPSPPDDSV